jgi:hypothetical protein
VRVVQLTLDSFDAYTRFHRALWPLHDAAGDWEIVLSKYFINPHVVLCPGSGLYACLNSNDDICGILGAYPMPITLNARLHPGHMLVDWAVLPRYWTAPHRTTNLQGKLIAGKLFAELVSLPGMKFSSYGSAYSQSPLERVAKKIPTVVAASILSPLNAALLEVLHLRNYAQPSPVSAAHFVLPGTAESMSPDELPTAHPKDPDNTAFVQRDSGFWSYYFQSRNHHGGSAFRLTRDGNTGYMVCNLLECGRIRFAILLALSIANHSVANARHLSKCAREALAKLNVSVVIATEADDCIRAFLGSLGKWVVRKDSHWWAIPKAGDSFCPEDVHWWLTSAERDAIWLPSPQTRSTEWSPRLATGAAMKRSAV